MTVMRAKMYVSSIEPLYEAERIGMNVVCSPVFGPRGESEDNTFARYTPMGNLSLMITNPDLVGKFRIGQKFYLDFTEAPDSPG